MILVTIIPNPTWELNNVISEYTKVTKKQSKKPKWNQENKNNSKMM